MKENKLRQGYCGITLSRYDDYPLVIYRINNGVPVLEENEILLIRLSKEGVFSKSTLCLNGENYVFLKGKFLKEYNQEKSPLSKEDWGKLREIVDNKIEKIEGRKLEEMVE